MSVETPSSVLAAAPSRVEQILGVERSHDVHECMFATGGGQGMSMKSEPTNQHSRRLTKLLGHGVDHRRRAQRDDARQLLGPLRALRQQKLRERVSRVGVVPEERELEADRLELLRHLLWRVAHLEAGLQLIERLGQLAADATNVGGADVGARLHLERSLRQPNHCSRELWQRRRLDARATENAEDLPGAHKGIDRTEQPRERGGVLGAEQPREQPHGELEELSERLAHLEIRRDRLVHRLDLKASAWRLPAPQPTACERDGRPR